MQKPITLSLALLLIFVASSFIPISRNPPGTAKISGLDNIYLDKTEVTNIAWKEYLYDLKERYGETSEIYNQNLPDPVMWEIAYGEPFGKSKNHDNYPVVAISYPQALSYCKWRSDRVSERENRSVTYSLPSMREYKVANRDADENRLAEGLHSTNFGVHTFSGICENASEMTNQEGQAIAGSSLNECLQILEYTEPSPSLGFRCMAVLK